MSPSASSTRIGTLALVLWSSLAVLTTFTGDVPALQLNALTFTMASGIGLFVWRRRGVTLAEIRALPLRHWALGVYGLLGYHVFYFLALKTAPVAEANLINYLWPLFMVLFASLLPGEGLRWFHFVGAALGFSGAVLLLTGPEGLRLDPAHTLGYLAALACALNWSSFSVLSRRAGRIPTHFIGAFCGATALISWGLHLTVEQWVSPSATEWGAIVLMGIGPMGLAFFAWDHGVKRGSIALLGALSYLTPLFSTLLLVVAGRAVPDWRLGGACALIVGGAVVAARPPRHFQRRSST